MTVWEISRRMGGDMEHRIVVSIDDGAFQFSFLAGDGVIHRWTGPQLLSLRDALPQVLVRLERAIYNAQNQPQSVGPRPARSGKPWTSEEEQKLSSLSAQGETVGEIAYALERTEIAVLLRMVQAGLVTLSAKPANEEATFDMELAKQRFDIVLAGGDDLHVSAFDALFLSDVVPMMVDILERDLTGSPYDECADAIERDPRSKGPKWTKQQEDVLFTGFWSGRDIFDLAAELKCSPQALLHRLHQEGILTIKQADGA